VYSFERFTVVNKGICWHSFLHETNAREIPLLPGASMAGWRAAAAVQSVPQDVAGMA
jgi:hypothetical protein